MGETQREITHFLEGIGISLKRLTPIESRKGLFGRIEIYGHHELGKVFVLNGEIQHVEAWSPLYHEPLVHLPAAFIPEVRDVLILGGGTLYAAWEALKYKSVKRVVLLDREPAVTQAVARHYEHGRRCLKDKRFTVLHKDAYSALHSFKSQFDLVVNDGIDLLSTVSHNDTERGAFRSMFAALKPGGVCVDVVFRHLFEKKRTRRTIGILRKRAHLALSLVFLPEYHGVLHTLCAWGGKKSSVAQTLKTPINKEQLHWIKRPQHCPCVYYAPRFLPYYLYLPRYIQSAVSPRSKAA